MRLTAVDVYDEAIRLEIDHQVSKLQTAKRGVRLAARWQSQNPIAFARRALEVAIMQSHDAEEVRKKGDWIAEWERLQKLVEGAEDALRELLVFLANGTKHLDTFGVAAVSFPLKPISTRVMPQSSISERHAWAEKTAEQLLGARAALLSLAPAIRDHGGEIAASRLNPGEPEKFAFVQILAQAWVYLTGSRPGRGGERNPFLRFVEAAWADARGPQDQNFARPLQRALKGL